MDLWWVEPVVIVTVLGAFVLYSMYAGLVGTNYYFDPYLSPLYSPCLTANCVHPTLPIVGSYWNLSPAIIIVAFPLAFRVTCYYYRRSYYRAFFWSPPACAVPDAHKSYAGETRFPFLIQNLHRYALIFATGDEVASGLLAFARQNLPLIVSGGKPNPNLSDGPQWGATLGNAIRVWRSGIGVDALGNLIYAAADNQTVGSLAQILIRAGARTKSGTIADAKTQQMVVAGTGAGSETDTWPVVLSEVLGTKCKLVTGYLGSQETILAIERGEAQGRCIFSLSALRIAKPDWLREAAVAMTASTIEDWKVWRAAFNGCPHSGGCA